MPCHIDAATARPEPVAAPLPEPLAWIDDEIAALREAGLERQIWQSFAVLPDIRTVGVMGDERTYGYPVIIRAVTSDDAMTADWAQIGRAHV